MRRRRHAVCICREGAKPSVTAGCEPEAARFQPAARRPQSKNRRSVAAGASARSASGRPFGASSSLRRGLREARHDALFAESAGAASSRQARATAKIRSAERKRAREDNTDGVTSDVGQVALNLFRVRIRANRFENYSCSAASSICGTSFDHTVHHKQRDGNIVLVKVQFSTAYRVPRQACALYLRGKYRARAERFFSGQS